MDRLDGTEIWRTIPPEEKLDIMNRAHAMGILSATITIVICSTIAVGLHMSWIMWGSLIVSPFIFQFSAGKAWRDYRPRLVLEFLAARSAARRYAFAAKSKDLSLALLFRGKFSEVFEQAGASEALEAALSHNRDATAWIALFTDAVIVMSEYPGGAKLEFANLINDRVTVEAKNENAEKEYSANKELYLSISPKKDTKESERKYLVTSNHAAALVVFEKKLQAYIEDSKHRAAELPEPVPQFEEPAPPDESMGY